MQQGKLPPPWVIMLFGGVFLFWAYEHYWKMVDFEAGVTDQVLMWSFMIALYDFAGFWPTVILPFVLAGAIAIAGIGLLIRDLRARVKGEAPAMEYEPVRWQGLLIATLVALAFIAGIFVLVFSIKLD